MLIAGCTSVPAPDCLPIAIDPVPTQLSGGDIERLESAPRDNVERERLARFYLESHCDVVTSDRIPGSSFNNHSCRIPGASEERIVVGAHYDKVNEGRGIIDNWTGVVLTARLLSVFEGAAPKYTWEFVMFGEEEPGMLGSAAWLADAGEADAPIRAMINLDTFGTGPVSVDRRSTDALACVAGQVAAAIGIPKKSSYLRQTMGDWGPFADRDIPVLNLNSLDRSALRIVHTRRDRFAAVDQPALRDTWKFIMNLALTLDEHLDEVTDSGREDVVKSGLPGGEVRAVGIE